MLKPFVLQRSGLSGKDEDITNNRYGRIFWQSCGETSFSKILQDCYSNTRQKVEFSEDIQVVAADLLEARCRERIVEEIKPDIILHLAWGRQDGTARNSDENIEWLEASYHLLRRFINNGGKQFVFAGSSSEYEEDCGLR